MVFQGESPTAFFSKTFEEATELLIEARDYLAADESVDRAQMSHADRMRLTCETTRLTSRLAHIMAWLMARKAVFSGELTAAEARCPPYVLGDDEIVARHDPENCKNMPDILSRLMERSHGLYTRVSRLDELARRNVRQGPLWST